MAQYVIQQVSIEEVHPAPWQPPSRTSPSAAMSSLRKSIQSHGLQYPPLVTRDPDGNGFTIADGHRRHEVMKALKWPTIPVLIAEGAGKDLFSTLSGTTKPMTALQWTQVYLAGGALPSSPNKTCITNLAELMGAEYLHNLVAAGLSPQIWNVANRMLRYTNSHEELKPKILTWLLKHKISREVSRWIADGDPADALLQALNEDRPPKH
jgi:hypothetical protein